MKLTDLANAVVMLGALVVYALLLSSCATDGKKRLPAATTPVHTVTEKRVYVPIDASLTEPCPIAEGPVADALIVARQRRAALEKCNSDKAQIRAIQGTPVKTP